MKGPLAYHNTNIPVKMGDHVEIMIQSALNCETGEQVKYEIGKITKTESDGLWVLLDKGDQKTEEFFSVEEMEYLLLKEYEILGYASPQKEMVLSVKGETFTVTIQFEYSEGSLLPREIRRSTKWFGASSSNHKEDSQILQELQKYGMYQLLSQNALHTKSLL